jgi:chromosome segregation ATPase
MTMFSFVLDLVLIALLLGGMVIGIKLTHQLAGLRQSRLEMERFIAEFAATVARAEAGVRGLKQAARSCGDDLEQLIERGTTLRDEMTFLLDSADQAATRLTNTVAETAPARARAEALTEAPTSKTSSVKPAAVKPADPLARTTTETSSDAAGATAASGAERELLRVLGKLR